MVMLMQSKMLENDDLINDKNAVEDAGVIAATEDSTGGREIYMKSCASAVLDYRLGNSCSRRTDERLRLAESPATRIRCRGRRQTGRRSAVGGRAQLWERLLGITCRAWPSELRSVVRLVVAAVRPSIATCRLLLTDDVNASVKWPETWKTPSCITWLSKWLFHTKCFFFVSTAERWTTKTTRERERERERVYLPSINKHIQRIWNHIQWQAAREAYAYLRWPPMMTKNNNNCKLPKSSKEQNSKVHVQAKQIKMTDDTIFCCPLLSASCCQDTTDKSVHSPECHSPSVVVVFVCQVLSSCIQPSDNVPSLHLTTVGRKSLLSFQYQHRPIERPGTSSHICTLAVGLYR